MKAKIKKQKIAIQAIKAARKKSREEEIRNFGKPINYNKVVASKKVYNRKKKKADQSDDLPFLPLSPKGE